MFFIDRKYTILDSVVGEEPPFLSFLALLYHFLFGKFALDFEYDRDLTRIRTCPESLNCKITVVNHLQQVSSCK